MNTYTLMNTRLNTYTLTPCKHHLHCLHAYTLQASLALPEHAYEHLHTYEHACAADRREVKNEVQP